MELGTSIFKLDEWLAIGKRDGVFRNTVAQCNYGLDHVKLTDLRGSIELPGAQATCTHVKRDMLVDGVWQHRAHAPLRGLAEDGSFRTRATAAYPSKFNKYLAEALVKAALLRCKKHQQVALPVQAELSRSSHRNLPSLESPVSIDKCFRTLKRSSTSLTMIKLCSRRRN